MKYFIITASKDHVQTGVEQGIAQAEHGKKTSLEKLRKDDQVIYYSSKDKYENGKPYQKFTAAGQVRDDEAYQAIVSDDFEPWRRDINYYSVNELEIRPLLDDLNFIKNPKKWGFYLMSEFVEIGKSDFELIAKQMLTHKKI